MSTLIERLRIKAGVMEMGERIAWGSDTALMREAAGKIEALEAQLEAVGADCESWYKQNQQSIDDANKFGGERDSAWAEVERLKADALRAAVAPDSWVLVPLEPTAKMLQAGQDTPVSESDEDAPEDYKAVYRAMLAAAPRHHQADDVCQNRTLRGGTLIDMVRDVEKHHGIGGEPQQIAGLDKDAEIERLKDALTFVERWANHHAQKPHVTAAEALSCIQHYPEIEAITESYADGKVPETRDPYAEITALKAERDALLKNDARYQFVVGSTDHSMAKWHDCEGWYAIEEVDLDADMQAQEVKPS